MNRDSMKALRLDRRLLSRRGWITTEELDKQLEALPDAAAKAQTLALDSESAEAPAEESAPEPESPTPGGPERPGGF